MGKDLEAELEERNTRVEELARLCDELRLEVAKQGEQLTGDDTVRTHHGAELEGQVMRIKQLEASIEEKDTRFKELVRQCAELRLDNTNKHNQLAESDRLIFQLETHARLADLKLEEHSAERQDQATQISQLEADLENKDTRVKELVRQWDDRLEVAKQGKQLTDDDTLGAHQGVDDPIMRIKRLEANIEEKDARFEELSRQCSDLRLDNVNKDQQLAEHDRFRAQLETQARPADLRLEEHGIEQHEQSTRIRQLETDLEDRKTRFEELVLECDELRLEVARKDKQLTDDDALRTNHAAQLEEQAMWMRQLAAKLIDKDTQCGRQEQQLEEQDSSLKRQTELLEDQAAWVKQLEASCQQRCKALRIREAQDSPCNTNGGSNHVD